MQVLERPMFGKIEQEYLSSTFKQDQPRPMFGKIKQERGLSWFKDVGIKRFKDVLKRLRTP